MSGSALLWQADPPAHAQATLVWDGSAGDGKWSTAANWDLNRQPIADDSLVFPDLPTTATLTNDMDPSIVYSDIRITSGDYTITGNTIRLKNGIVLNPLVAEPTA
jgi:hypothetical protein